MNTVYVVFLDSVGHEPDALMSIWTDKSLANAEKDTLIRKFGEGYSVKEIELNKSNESNIMLNW